MGELGLGGGRRALCGAFLEAGWHFQEVRWGAPSVLGYVKRSDPGALPQAKMGRAFGPPKETLRAAQHGGYKPPLPVVAARSRATRPMVIHLVSRFALWRWPMWRVRAGRAVAVPAAALPLGQAPDDLGSNNAA